VPPRSHAAPRSCGGSGETAAPVRPWRSSLAEGA
jgi:hypothetical protein